MYSIIYYYVNTTARIKYVCARVREIYYCFNITILLPNIISFVYINERIIQGISQKLIDLQCSLYLKIFPLFIKIRYKCSNSFCFYVI